MAGTIAPLVQRHRIRTAVVACLSLGAGMLLSAAVVGFSLGSIGVVIGLESVPVSARSAILGGLSGIWLLQEARILHLPLPYMRKQVPAIWRRKLGPVVGSGLYGLTLGVGLLTFLGTTGIYVVLASAVVIAEPRAAAAVVMCYGAGRLVAIVAELSLQLSRDDEARLMRFSEGGLRTTQELGLAGLMIVAGLQLALSV